MSGNACINGPLPRLRCHEPFRIPRRRAPCRGRGRAGHRRPPSARPFYCYSTATLTRHYRVFADAFADIDSLVCYAMKANSNQAVIATLARLGAGVDVVSRRRIAPRRWRPACPPKRSCFPASARPPTKSTPDLPPASCASTSNPSRNSRPVGARRRGRQDGAASRFRINPDVDAEDARQDLDRQEGRQVRHRLGRRARRSMTAPRRLPGIEVTGIDMHIGSQITDLEPFDHAFAPPRRPGRRIARRRPHDRAMSISAAASAFPIASTTSPPPDPGAYADDRSSATSASSAAR